MKRFLIFILILVSSSTSASSEKIITTNNRCSEMGDCDAECTEKCGCDTFVKEAYIYNETTNECQINMKYLMRIMVEKYNNEEKIRVQAEKIFKGVLIAAVIFITCASICTLTACVYCCRINYADFRLQSDIKALGKKLGRDKERIVPKIKLTTKPEAESCNVVCEDAGVFVC